MQLYISAYLLDETFTGVIAAIRTVAFRSHNIFDQTYFLSPAEQLSVGRTISDIALCELAYTDLYNARHTFPVDPTGFMSLTEITTVLLTTLHQAEQIFVPDEYTYPALLHMLASLHHLPSSPPVRLLPGLEFFTPLGTLEQHFYRNLRAVA
jgi:hypothetical protein